MSETSETKYKKLWKLLNRVQKVDIDSLQKAFAHHLEFTIGKNRYTLSDKDLYMALSYTIRDHLIDRWNETQQTYYQADTKRVYYLSMEFLMGRTLENSLINLRAYSVAHKALAELGIDLGELFAEEHDAGLGNGGLGRLAACFLDSMATMSLPGYGYGIRYNYGIFKQKIIKGYQTEIPDMWLTDGNPWEMERFDITYPIRFFGHVESFTDNNGDTHFSWVGGEKVMAKAWDCPIPGYNNNTVNNLRLWTAEAAKEFNFNFFNEGDYIKAVEEKINSENISSVLYPNDNMYAGKELRLKQQYVMVSASLQDIVRRYAKIHHDWKDFPNKVAIQLNDTHPAMAVVELMRILMDEKGLGWDESWQITQQTFAYTNHTVLPEALEKWSVSLVERLLPRHMQIIYEINQRFISEIAKKFPGDDEFIKRVSLIEEGGHKMVRMAFLAVVASHTVNGVAALHSRLIIETIFADFYRLYPQKFQNKTNGITQRRWLALANRPLARLITSKIGRKWLTNLSSLKEIEQFADDPEFQADWAKVKRTNKELLAKIIKQDTGIIVSPDSMFDVQVKRIHEYKRQHLNIFNAISLYHRIKAEPNKNWTPRTIIFGGKAAPGYYIAKLIIKLIHEVADLVNNDKVVNNYLKIVFLPDYKVSLAERIMPACDLSQQISTAGTEASGTGNMKFALNGALTIGTLDGANIEMLEEIGEESFFIFGLKIDEVQKLKTSGYNPYSYYNANKTIRETLDFCMSLAPENNVGLFHPLINTLLDGQDPFMVLADMQSYAEKQDEVSQVYSQPKRWLKMSILNSARMGKFSSDRTIDQYAKEIWDINPVAISDPAKSNYWK